MANETFKQSLTSGQAREAIDAATSWAGEHDGSQAGNVSGDAQRTSQDAGAQGGKPGSSSAKPPNAPSGTDDGQTPDEDVSPMHDGP